MSPEEYEVYSQKGYGYNDLIGKRGVEQIFEDFLRGTDGKKMVGIDENSSDTSATAADGEWDEYVCCYFAHHINDRSCLIGGGGDIEEHNFIGSCLVICFCNFHRISGIS